MNFGDSVKKNLTTSYADFSGRATRSEFWFFALFWTLVLIVASVADAALFGTSRQKPLLYFIASIAFFLPSAGLGWRRMADVGLPGWLSLPATISTGFYLLILAGSLTENKPIEEDVELFFSLLVLFAMLPFIIICCLPTKNTPPVN